MTGKRDAKDGVIISMGYGSLGISLYEVLFHF